MSDSIVLPLLSKALDTARLEYAKANQASAAAFAKAKASGIAGGTNRASIFYTPFPLHLLTRRRRPRQLLTVSA